MPTELQAQACSPTDVHPRAGQSSPPISVTLLTGGQDPHYALGLARSLMSQDVALDVIGGDESDQPVLKESSRTQFFNLHGSQSGGSRTVRIGRILLFYTRLLRYTLSAKPRVFHILWNNKLQFVDRTLLMTFYRALGKKVVLTAHNVNAGKRDGTDSWLNRATLRFQYRLTSNIFVHTRKMKEELVNEFGVAADKVIIIPYGINDVIPFTSLTPEEARQQLGIRQSEKVLLYFGAIKSYKGLEYLVEAFQQIAAEDDYRLIIAGERKKGQEAYWDAIQQTIESHPSHDKILQSIKFIPDAEAEAYFKAADVAVLPYTDIFQSGILFVAYNYGTPVIATDVGSFADDIDIGRTGFICAPRDSGSLAESIKRYFDSGLYRELPLRRKGIRESVLADHSWETVAVLTTGVYSQLA
ncbi:MAG: glycosyltransferase family 4 protein [Acidobacteria bacterium]|nr:glycosyltransferase family 4 protein [Acidobacteriota bacterium]